MKILICGDREWDDGDAIYQVLGSVLEKKGVKLLVHGDARGADTLAGKAAELLGIDTHAMPADWDTHGKAAGPIRNAEMLSRHPELELVLAFNDRIDESKGTWDMIQQAVRKRVGTYLIRHGGGSAIGLSQLRISKTDKTTWKALREGVISWSRSVR